MSQDYLTRIKNSINYLKRMEELKKESERLLLQREENMNSCKHEILLTFGEKTDERVFGTFQKYYCVFCKKMIKDYSRHINMNKEKAIATIDFSNQVSDVSDINSLMLLIEENLKEYLTDFKDLTLEDIGNYLSKLDINDLKPKVKKI